MFSPMLCRSSKPGFLGPTAYSAVYTENPESLGMMDPKSPVEEEDNAFLPAVSQGKIEQGAEILAVLRDTPLFQRLIDSWFSLPCGIVVIQPAFRIWVEGLWAEFGNVLTQGTHSQLLRLSELLFRNTRHEFKPHGRMSPSEWSKAATGRNIRWEVIGIIFSAVGLTVMELRAFDSIFDDFRESIVDRCTFGERMRKIAETCLCFCYVSLFMKSFSGLAHILSAQECEAINDLYICFLYQDLVLVEALKGDARESANVNPLSDNLD